jgi:NAD(P)H-dependent FMN reductase
VQAQRAWLPVLRTLRMRPWFGAPLYVSAAANVFDGEGRLVDADVRARLQQLLSDFAQAIS